MRTLQELLKELVPFVVLPYDGGFEEKSPVVEGVVKSLEDIELEASDFLYKEVAVQ